MVVADFSFRLDGDDDVDNGDVMVRLWYLYDEDLVRFKQKAYRYEPARVLFTKAVCAC